ncbi:MAG: glutathione S-transferase N-terminal domain-containing protein [Proteobacteria bacterium]|nr:glutathione S-transferase N-terminal domain-containing protein [Pseudomonadota bacterium]
MIETYTWGTPNGHKVHIMLEETGLPYTIYPVDIRKGEQFSPEFLRISPNNKIPAIIDTEGPENRPIALFESGAILFYLAEKTQRFLPSDPINRYSVLQWLMFQMGTVGPMLGQAHHFRQYSSEPLPYAIDRYTNEARRIYGVIDIKLAETPYIAGDVLSIADFAIFPWLRHPEKQGVDIKLFPYLKRWHDEISARPAVIRALKILQQESSTPMSDKAKSVLFGKEQYSQHRR